jgi:hypothetical protein
MTFSTAEILEEHRACTQIIRAGKGGVLTRSMCHFSEITPIRPGFNQFVIRKDVGVILRKRIQEKPVEVMKENIEKTTQ